MASIQAECEVASELATSNFLISGSEDACVHVSRIEWVIVVYMLLTLQLLHSDICGA